MKKITAAVLAILSVLNLTACSDNKPAAGTSQPDFIGSAPTSDTSEAPSVPDEASLPETSEVTSEPDASETSEAPSVPDTSDVSDASDTSEAPSEPDTSDVPSGGDDDDVYKLSDKTFAPIETSNDSFKNSVKLFDAMYEDNKQAMFSPLSLNMCLGMLQAGADSNTKAALSNYLGTDSYAEFAEKYMEHTADFNTESNSEYSKYKNVFEIANSVWASELHEMTADYMTEVKAKFDAELDMLDFSDAVGASDRINGWVNGKTHEMIPKIVSPDMLSADTAAVLVNTVYFESAWSDEWWVQNEKVKFANADGSASEIEFMRNGGDAYYENDKATAFACTYKNGMRFIGILPKNEGDFTLEELDIPSLLESKSYDYDVFAGMPKLEFDSSFPLTNVLKAAGLEDIFNPETADFLPMQVDKESERFFVSQILQKTRLELDEEGTRAAAVTAAIMDAASAMPEQREQKEVLLNRPFAFLIYDEAENEAVFMGKVTALDAQ